MSEEAAAPDPMAAEFDTVAEWTAEAALALGEEYHVPGGCRGCGGPDVLDWLLDRLGVTERTRLLDVGAGVGGAAAYARERHGLSCVHTDLEAGACRAARTLFDLPTLRSDAAALPFRPAVFDAAWCLGVLCTMTDQRAVIEELARVVRPGGTIGLVVYVATEPIEEGPEGNNFPGHDRLERLLDVPGLEIVEQAGLAELPAPSQLWTDQLDTVHREIARRHGDQPAWQTSLEQEQTLSGLLAAGTVVGELACLRVVSGGVPDGR